MCIETRVSTVQNVLTVPTVAMLAPLFHWCVGFSNMGMSSALAVIQIRGLGMGTSMNRTCASYEHFSLKCTQTSHLARPYFFAVFFFLVMFIVFLQTQKNLSLSYEQVRKN
jgi:hypothetical protein